MIFLDVADLLVVAERATGRPAEVRDLGLLHSAAARPRASVMGQDAYPTFADKAAALVHSIANNHPLVDGNKRLALAALVAFAGVNGLRLSCTNDEAYELIMDVAEGRADDVPGLALRIAPMLQPR